MQTRRTIAGSGTGPAAQLFPASFVQRRMWFVEQLRPGGTAYLVSVALRLRGALDVTALAGALSDLVARHDALRTGFWEEDGEPVQVVSPTLPFRVRHLDLTGLTRALAEQQARVASAAEGRRPFDLTRPPLFRALLVAVQEDEHHLVLAMHHLVSDGWSCELLAAELGEFYRARVERRPAEPRRSTASYADFAKWQWEWLRSDSRERQMAYWRRQLAGATAVRLPESVPGRTVDGDGAHEFMLPAALDHGLTELSRHAGASLFMTLLAAFGAVLRAYGAGDDVLVCAPVANRGRRELEGVIGCLVNTLAFRIAGGGDPTFREFLVEVRETILSGYEHQDLPFDQIVDDLRPERDGHGHPLFRIGYSLHDSTAVRWRFGAVAVEPLPRAETSAKFDLALYVNRTGNGLAFRLIYRTAALDHDAAARMGVHLRTFLTNAVAAPDAPLSRLGVLPPAEHDRLMLEWNGSGAPRVSAPLFPDLVAAWAHHTPNAIAVRTVDGCLSYGELDRRAKELARRLRGRGIGPEALVPLCLPAGAALVVAIMGVLKAGGAYVPLDPGAPLAWIALVLADVSPRVVVTEVALRDRLPESTPLLLLDGDLGGDGGQATGLQMPVPGHPRRAAYVIFTSGSTGRPKGVVVEHGSLAAYVKRCVTAYPALADGALLHTPAAFDLSVTSLHGTLAAGGELQVSTLDERATWPKEAPRFGLLKVTPGHLPALTGLPETCSPLRELMSGGEALHAVALADWRRTYPRARVVNHYGPTEATVGCIDYAIEPGIELPAGTVPIGQPFTYARAYVLDPWLRAAPVGVAGELYVGGAGLARGYLGQPGQTAQLFVADPHGAPGSRMYRTGDLARWRADGALEYLGRVDNQVKIRGYRVEPAAVDSALADHPAVAEVVTVAREDAPGDRRLVTYVVGRGDGRPGGASEDGPFTSGAAPAGLADELHAFARRTLPAYLTPSAVVVLPRLPLTANGKVDVRELPAPAVARPEPVAPRTPTEERLCELFAEVLGVAQVGVEDDFFDLGGHSLLAMRLVSRVRTVLRRELVVAAVFDASTVARLALRLDAAPAARPALRPHRPEGAPS